jgi:DNA-binding XRE family transcriptional regulator
MRSTIAQAIFDARRASGLTQAQLGHRLGKTGQAVFRWEWDKVQPSLRTRRELVAVIQALQPVAAARLSVAFGFQDAPVALPPAAAPLQGFAALEAAVFKMSDELDLPPRRVRGALTRLARRLREASLPLEETHRLLEQWVAAAE